MANYTGRIWVTVQADTHEEAVSKLVDLADKVRDEEGLVIGAIYADEVFEEEDEDA